MGRMQAGRRNFCEAAIYILAGMVATALGLPAGFYLFGSPRSEAQSDWVDAGDISNLPAGAPRQITFVRNRMDGWSVRSTKDSAWVVKDGPYDVTVFAPLCTHLGCAYHWEPKGRDAKDGVFACPCHGSAFSRSGEVLSGPATRPLDQYVTKIEGARLWLGKTKPSAES
ncbi:MAG TPA: ubiquinol-cytochrome c reductase iron-sulfur subunit [Bryobacteraceae bacterium]